MSSICASRPQHANWCRDAASTFSRFRRASARSCLFSGASFVISVMGVTKTELRFRIVNRNRNSGSTYYRHGKQRQEIQMMATAQEFEKRRWIALALLAVAQFVVVLDASIVNVALPTTGDSLSFS